MTRNDGPEPAPAATTNTPPAATPGEPTPEEVGARIRELRLREPRMSQRRLGVAIGKSERAVWSWENGEAAIEWEHLRRLGRVFNVDPHDIYGKPRHPQEDPEPIDWRIEEAGADTPASRSLSTKLLEEASAIRADISSLRAILEELTRLATSMHVDLQELRADETRPARHDADERPRPSADANGS